MIIFKKLRPVTKVGLSGSSVFLAYIGLFASFYAFVIPNHFAFSSAEYSENFRIENKALASHLEEILTVALNQDDQNKTHLNLGSEFRSKFDPYDNFEKFDPKDRLLFEVRIGRIITTPGEERQSDMTLIRFVMTVWYDLTSLDEVTKFNAGVMEVPCSIEIAQFPGSDIEPYGIVRCSANLDRLWNFDSPGEYFLYGSNYRHPVVEQLQDLGNARFNHLERGMFWRMFYFSAVTATTLGYGDIIPVTNTARMTVAIQSVLGLFLMGFLVFMITSAAQASLTRSND